MYDLLTVQCCKCGALAAAAWEDGAAWRCVDCFEFAAGQPAIVRTMDGQPHSRLELDIKERSKRWSWNNTPGEIAIELINDGLELHQVQPLVADIFGQRAGEDLQLAWETIEELS